MQNLILSVHSLQYTIFQSNKHYICQEGEITRCKLHSSLYAPADMTICYKATSNRKINFTGIGFQLQLFDSKKKKREMFKKKTDLNEQKTINDLEQSSILWYKWQIQNGSRGYSAKNATSYQARQMGGYISRVLLHVNTQTREFGFLVTCHLGQASNLCNQAGVCVSLCEALACKHVISWWWVTSAVLIFGI